MFRTLEMGTSEVINRFIRLRVLFPEDNNTNTSVPLSERAYVKRNNAVRSVQNQDAVLLQTRASECVHVENLTNASYK